MTCDLRLIVGFVFWFVVHLWKSALPRFIASWAFAAASTEQTDVSKHSNIASFGQSNADLYIITTGNSTKPYHYEL